MALFIIGLVVGAVIVAGILFYMATHAHGSADSKEIKQSIESIDKAKRFKYDFREIVKKIYIYYDHYEDMPMRLLECTNLEVLLGEYERSIPTNGRKYHRWCASAIRDALFYTNMNKISKEKFVNISIAVESLFLDCNNNLG